MLFEIDVNAASKTYILPHYFKCLQIFPLILDSIQGMIFNETYNSDKQLSFWGFFHSFNFSWLVSFSLIQDDYICRSLEVTDHTASLSPGPAAKFLYAIETGAILYHLSWGNKTIIIVNENEIKFPGHYLHFVDDMNKGLAVIVKIKKLTNTEIFNMMIHCYV